MKPSINTKNIGLLLLAIYLIIVGLIGVFGINLGQLSILVPILALAAGVMILIGRYSGRDLPLWRKHETCPLYAD